MEKKLYYRCEPNDNGSFSIKEKMLFGKGKNCFLTKEEAINHFEKAERIALDKYEKIIIGLNELKKELGDFSYECGAWALDDTGLETTMYIEFNVDGYDFRFNQ